MHWVESYRPDLICISHLSVNDYSPRQECPVIPPLRAIGLLTIPTVALAGFTFIIVMKLSEGSENPFGSTTSPKCAFLQTPFHPLTRKLASRDMTQIMHDIVRNELCNEQTDLVPVPESGDVFEFAFYNTSDLHSDAQYPLDIALIAGYPHTPKEEGCPQSET